MSQVIFNSTQDIQPDLGATQNGVRSLIEAVVETAKKESPAIIAGTGARFDSPEAEAGRQATGRVETAVLAANKRLLLNALAASGIETAVVQYEGSGDSGGVEDVDFSPSGVDVESKKTILLATEYGWIRDKSVTVSIKALGLKNALTVFTESDLVSYFGHSGYENNEGGGGEAVFDVLCGKVTLTHYDYVVDRNETDHVLL